MIIDPAFSEESAAWSGNREEGCVSESCRQLNLNLNPSRPEEQ